MADIDRLDIVINAKVKQASRDIGTLATRMDRLAQSASDVNSDLPSLAKGINDLADATDKLNSYSLDMLKYLASGLKALGGIKIQGDFKVLADGIRELSDAVSLLGAIDSDIVSLERLATAVRKFGTQTATNSKDNFSGMTSGLIDLTNAVDLVSAVDDSALTKLDDITKQITRLGGTTANNTARNLGEISVGILDFAEGINSSETIDSNKIQGLQDASKAVNAFGYSSSTHATTNLPRLGRGVKSFVDNVNSSNLTNLNIAEQLGNLSRSVNRIGKNSDISKNLESVSEAIKNLVNGLNEVQVNDRTLRLVEALGNIRNSKISYKNNTKGNSKDNAFTKGLKGVFGGAKKTIGFFAKDLGAYVGKAFHPIKNALGTARKFVSTFATTYNQIRGGLDLVKGFMSSSMDYIETYNYLKQSIAQLGGRIAGEGGKTGDQWANEFLESVENVFSEMTGFSSDSQGYLIRDTVDKSFGLNPTTTMNYQAQFAQLASSMGTASEKAVDLSEALTKIGADLASVRNMKFEDVWTNLSSGIVGMSRAVDRYGINLRANAMDEKLLQLGINATSKSLNQADKALLRTIIILDSSQYAWGDLAKTIDQPANQLRLLSSNMTNLSRTIGNIFLPMVASILPYLNALVIVLEKVAEYFVALLGVGDFKWGGTSSGNSELTSDILDQSDALDDATKSAKEYQNQLLGFDEINKLNDSNDSGGDANGLIDATAQLEDAFKKAYERYLKAWQSAFDEMGNSSNEIANKMLATFDDLISSAERKDWEGLGRKIARIINRGFSELVLATDNLPDRAENFFGAIIDTLNSVTENVDAKQIGLFASNIANSVINSLYEVFVEYDYKELGAKIGEALNAVFDKVDFEKMGNTVGGVLTRIPNILIGVINELDWSDVGKAISDALNGIFEVVDIRTIFTGASRLVNGLVDSLGEIITGTDWSDVVKDFVDGINAFFKKTDFQELGSVLGAIVINLVDSAFTLLFNTDYAELIESLFEFLGGVLIGSFRLLYPTADDEMRKFNERLNKDFGEFENDVFKIDIKFQGIEESVEKWEALKEKLNPTAEDLAEIQRLELEISQELPGFNDIIGDTTKSWKDQKKAVHDLIDEQKAYYLSLAKADYMKEYDKELIKLQLDERKLKKEQIDLSDTVADFNYILDGHEVTIGDLVRIQKEAQNGTRELSKAEEDLILDHLDEIDKLNNLNDKLGVNVQKQEAVNNQIVEMDNLINGLIGTQDDASESAKELSDAMGEIGITEEQRQAQDEAFKLLQKAISDTEFGVDDLEDALGKLNLDEAAKRRIIQAFLDIKNGAESSGKEVGKYFSKGIKSGINLESVTIVPKGSLGNAVLPSIKYEAYASGGFPEDGFFYANHNELVGKFANGRTAVANNQQITEGIRQAVMEGMMAVMSNTGSSSPVIENIFKVDSETLYRMVQKGQQSTEGRFHTVSAF